MNVKVAFQNPLQNAIPLNISLLPPKGKAEARDRGMRVPFSFFLIRVFLFMSVPFDEFHFFVMNSF